MPRQQPTNARRSLRLSQYDYTSAGAYFVTLCVRNRECTLGDVVDDRMILSAYGEIAAESWQWLAQQYPYVSLDAWVIMPNNLHGILIMEDEGQKGGLRAAPTGPPGGSRAAPAAQTAPKDPSFDSHVPGTAATPAPKRKPLGGLIGAFKTVSSKRINALRSMSGQSFWQRDYYEHVIRNERELNAIREYIVNNPLQWMLDRDHPDNIAR